MGSHVPGRVCAYCDQEKAWIFSGKKLRDGSRIYTNEFAARWAGRRCPDCERQRVYAAMKCNAFEKQQVFDKLREAGFQVRGDTLPVLVEKDGRTASVAVRKARAEGGEIILNQPADSDAELYALVFSSVRICTREQLERMQGQVKVFSSGRRKKTVPSTPERIHKKGRSGSQRLHE